MDGSVQLSMREKKSEDRRERREKGKTKKIGGRR